MERWGSALLPGEDFRIEATQVGERLFLVFVLDSPERGETLTLEAQLSLASYPDHDSARYHGIDALDALLGEYLEGGRELFFPAEWKLARFQGLELAYRGAVRRLRLEREADRLLGGAAGAPAEGVGVLLEHEDDEDDEDDDSPR